MTTIKSELIELKQKSGDLLQVESVVEWAEAHPNSALHHSLEWDDEIAGHAWRCQQVRQLISIHVVNSIGVREMVSLTIDRAHAGGGYRDISEVVEVPDLREVLLRDAIADLERVEKRYEALKELAKVWDELHIAKSKKKARKQRGEKHPVHAT